METFTDTDQTIERDGFTLRASVEYDDHQGAPWDEEDGHGPVSDWRRRNYQGRYAKAPGELLLHADCGSARFYDFAAAVKKALAEGWDAKPYNTGQETKHQQAAKAAMADYARLRGWCLSDWEYVGVVVTASKEGVQLGVASLWRIESDARDYLIETANELAEEALDAARAMVARIAA